MRVVFKCQELPDEVGRGRTELLFGGHKLPDILEYEFQPPFPAILLVDALSDAVNRENHTVKTARYKTLRIIQRHRQVRRGHREKKIFLRCTYKIAETLVKERLPVVVEHRA